MGLSRVRSAFVLEWVGSAVDLPHKETEGQGQLVCDGSLIVMTAATVEHWLAPSCGEGIIRACSVLAVGEKRYGVLVSD